jgi:hypothetical protein
MSLKCFEPDFILIYTLMQILHQIVSFNSNFQGKIDKICKWIQNFHHYF